MKSLAIRDSAAEIQKDLAYLLYDGQDFTIELPEEADPWELPLLLSSACQKGMRHIEADWARAWVQQRIIPPNRHNIQQILRRYGLRQYNEFQLLMLNQGRCTQDSYYLVPVKELPRDMQVCAQNVQSPEASCDPAASRKHGSGQSKSRLPQYLIDQLNRQNRP